MDNMLNSDAIRGVARVFLVGCGAPYSIEQNDGSINEGCSLYYVPVGDILKTHVNPDNGALGYVPQSLKMVPEFHAQVSKFAFPLYVNMHYIIRFGSKGGKFAAEKLEFDSGEIVVLSAAAADVPDEPIAEPVEDKKGKK